MLKGKNKDGILSSEIFGRGAVIRGIPRGGRLVGSSSLIGGRLVGPSVLVSFKLGVSK